MTETQRPTQEERERAMRACTENGWCPDETLRKVLLALAAENKALDERVRKARALVESIDTVALNYGHALQIERAIVALAADDAKAAGEPAVAVSADVAKSLTTLLHPASDSRASRRRAYVLEHAPRFLRTMLENDPLAVVEALRRMAIEQAGLIFDETESE